MQISHGISYLPDEKGVTLKCSCGWTERFCIKVGKKKVGTTLTSRAMAKHWKDAEIARLKKEL